MFATPPCPGSVELLCAFDVTASVHTIAGFFAVVQLLAVTLSEKGPENWNIMSLLKKGVREVSGNSS